MAAVESPFAGSRKRGRADDDDGMTTGGGLFSKKVRQTLDANGQPDVEPWQHDSVIGTPTTSTHKPKYDSDDQSSMVSEPGSPQEMADSSGDEMDIDMDSGTFSQSPDDAFTPPRLNGVVNSSPWRERVQSRGRVATPFTHTAKSSSSSLQLRTAFNKHVRHRHPQENINSDHLEVPSPIDEDEAQTPPSAAEAAGSQLSMLSVSDMDIETAADLPSITVESARNLQYDGAEDHQGLMTPGGLSPMTDENGVMLRKQRSRSGAQSNGSVSPVRLPSERDMGGVGIKRGISLGYRADCEKCRMRVPGHMNHFV
ncbi:hypothetical protein LTR56_013309 [Elasticomyces elasticus]|nr:hypothetical protein LTR56_013309 [Elasticomyces elasticus]KAK3668441.1 hypothetical protein LTR22_000734 [Elasticomyces elasticus]KAK4930870.1 hypothetical protein LTR49_002635 [Elasticomyces elasticus]KAK5753679.1 hypothetical protein LTS12_016204 [Elasticomyces elasticus]